MREIFYPAALATAALALRPQADALVPVPRESAVHIYRYKTGACQAVLDCYSRGSGTPSALAQSPAL